MNPLLNWPQKAQKGPWGTLPRKSPRDSKKRGADGPQPPWGRGPPMPKSAPPPARPPAGPEVLPPAQPPAAPRPPAPAPRPHGPPQRPALSLPPRRAPSTQARLARGGHARPVLAWEGGSSPAPAAPTRAYTPIPPYTRVWVCVRGCAGVHVPVHMHTCATHRLPERARRLFLLRYGVPSHPQHNRCRRPRRRAMRPFLAPRIRHIYMEK